MDTTFYKSSNKYKRRNFYSSAFESQIIYIDEILNLINQKIVIPNIKNLYYMSSLNTVYDKLRIRFFNNKETFYKNIREREEEIPKVSTFYTVYTYIEYFNMNNSLYSFMKKDEAFDKLDKQLNITLYNYNNYNSFYDYNMMGEFLNDKYKEKQRLKNKIDILNKMYQGMLPVIFTLNNHINFNKPNLFYKNINKLFLLNRKIKYYEEYILSSKEFNKSHLSETEIFIFNMIIYAFEKKLHVTTSSIIKKLGIDFGDYKLPYTIPLEEIVMRYDNNKYTMSRQYNFNNIISPPPPNVSDKYGYNKYVKYTQVHLNYDINKLLE